MTVAASATVRSGGVARGEAALAALALVLCVLAAFRPAFDAGFVNWDDPRNLLENPHFRGLTPEHLRWMFTTRWMGPYQPLSWLSLALDHALYGLGATVEHPEAAGYHRTSVVLHAGAALAFFAAARALFARVRPESGARARLIAAWGAAALFALHPLRVESVAWITERRDVLSGLFFALALWAWFGWAPLGASSAVRVRALLATLGASLAAALLALASLDLTGPEGLRLRPWGAGGLVLALALWVAASIAAARVFALGRAGRYLASGVLFALSLLAKGTGTPLPLALLVLDLWPLGRLRPRDARVALALVAEKAPLFALSAVTGRLAVWGQADALLSWGDHPLGERLLQSAYALVWYVAKSCVPSGLSAMHELPPELSLAEPRFALAAGALALGVVVALALARRAPLVPATLAAFALLIAPVCGISQAGAQIVAERYTYLPAMPLCLGLGGALLAAFAARPSAPAWWWCAPLALALPLGLATARLTRTWRSSEALWEHALRVDPKSPAAHQFLALVRSEQVATAPDPEAKRARMAEAIELLERGYALGGSPEFLPHLRDAYLKAAGLARDGGAREAELALERSRQWVAARGAGLTERLEHALLCLRFERADEARELLEPLARAAPDRPDVWLALGSARQAQGDHERAVEALERATALEPDSTSAWLYLGRSREALGRIDGARAAYGRVLALQPSHLSAREALARLAAGG